MHMFWKKGNRFKILYPFNSKPVLDNFQLVWKNKDPNQIEESKSYSTRFKYIPRIC